MTSLVLDRTEKTSPKLLQEEINDFESGYIFIAGPTCSGKTSLAHRLEEFFMSRRISTTMIKQDDYMKNLSDIPKNEFGYLTDGMNAFYIDEMMEDFKNYIVDGKAKLPLYDISDNRRLNEKQYILKTKITIVEGLHTIFLFHGLLDSIYIYLDTAIEECIKRRIEREKYHFKDKIDVEKCVLPSYENEILPQRDYDGVILL